MSDGTTGFQVAPTEDEAMKLSQLFSKAAEAIVNASTMPAQIAALSAQLHSLQGELDRAELHATELDQTVHELRAERDQAKADVASLQQTVDQVEADRQAEQRRREFAETRVDELTTALYDASRAHDDAELHGLGLKEKLDEANKIIDGFRAHARNVLGLIEPPKPTPLTPAVHPAIPDAPQDQSDQPAATGTDDIPY